MENGNYTKEAKLEYVGNSGGIDEFKLSSNGMRVLLAEENSAPVVVTMVTYHVGSRNEAIGYTGSTHLLEHLMFKGSKNYNKEKGTSIWTVLQSVGANINATTWNDRTNYFELLPKEHLETALSIESDRMRTAFINESDRQTEMTVVRNEFERGENDPHEALDKAIWATAYQAHPYHHSTIGWKSDIENVPIERLREFYNTFYHPNNATLTIVGDFDREAVKNLVLKYFGVITPSSHKIPDMYTEEPEQEGQRRVTVKRVGKTGYIGVGFKTPPALHNDQYSLRVLANILTSGKASRLYKVIVDKALSTWISADNSTFKDNGLFIIYTQLTPNVKHEDIEKIILEEIEKIKTDGVTEEEVQRAKAQTETALALSRDGPLSIARNLNEAIAIGDWKWYTTLIDNIRAVTPESVKKATQKYFLEDQSTIGYFIPKADKEVKAKVEEKGEQKISNDLKAIAPQTEQVSKKEAPKASYAERIVVSDPVPGIKLLTMKTAIKDVITLYGSFIAGERLSPEHNLSIATFTTKMLDQGTLKRTKFQISEILGSVGATISFSCGKFHVRFSSKFLKKDIPLVLELLAEQLREPAFNAADLETLKKREIARLEQAKQNTDTRAELAFSQSLYPRGHTNYSYSIEEAIEFIQKLTLDDIKNYHRENYGKGTFKIVAVGDLDEEVLSASLKQHFGEWRTSPILNLPAPKMKANPSQTSQQLVNIQDKTSCDVYIGNAIGIDRDHPDFLPLVVANFALGGDFSARLMDNVRDKEGLTYGIYSLISGCDFGSDGYFAIWGTFSPALLEKGVESTLKQLQRWSKDGVSAEELNTKKASITGSYKVRLATTGGLADNILTNEERGRPTSYLDEYPNLINKITLEQINQAISKYVNLNALTKVAAGSFETQSKL